MAPRYPDDYSQPHGRPNYRLSNQAAYKTGVQYAIEQITANAPDVSLYIDAAHGGWLGWEDNINAFTTLLSTLKLP